LRTDNSYLQSIEIQWKFTLVTNQMWALNNIYTADTSNLFGPIT